MAATTGKSDHLMFIAALLLVSPVGNMEPHLTNWVTKPGHVPRDFELATYQFESVILTYWAIRNTMFELIWAIILKNT